MNIESIPKEIVCKHIVPIANTKTIINLSQACRYFYAIIIENHKKLWNREIDSIKNPELAIFQFINGINFFITKFESINILLRRNLLISNDLHNKYLLIARNNCLSFDVNLSFIENARFSENYKKIVRLYEALEEIEQNINYDNKKIKFRLVLYFLVQFFDVFISSILIAWTFFCLKETNLFWNKSMYAAMFGNIVSACMPILFINYFKGNGYSATAFLEPWIESDKMNQTILYYIQLISKVSVASIYCIVCYILYFYPNILYPINTNEKNKEIPIFGQTHEIFKFRVRN